MIDFETAKDKVMMGKERKSMIISEEEKNNTAYHEAGHALVAKLTPGTDPLHKVSIIPRGMALGVTQQLPVDDRYTYSKDNILSKLAVLMGGRAAEEIALGHMTTGAGNDLQRATDLARKMVCEWGMSDKLGPLTFGKREEQIFLGKELTRHKDYSEKTAEDIDGEVRTIVGERYDYAKQLLLDNRETLEKVAERLLDKETLDADELEDVITGNNGSTAKDEKLVKESDEVKKAEGVEKAKDDKKDNDENGAA
jgi:cell division protease FtsH